MCCVHGSEIRLDCKKKLQIGTSIASDPLHFGLNICYKSYYIYLCMTTYVTLLTSYTANKRYQQEKNAIHLVACTLDNIRDDKHFTRARRPAVLVFCN